MAKKESKFDHQSIEIIYIEQQKAQLFKNNNKNCVSEVNQVVQSILNCTLYNLY